MQQIQRTPTNILNTDDDFGEVAAAHHISNENFRYGTTEAGATKRWEAVTGNTLIPNPYLPTTGINERHGLFASEASNTVLYLNANSLGMHGIYALIAGVWYKSLLDAQVTGGLLFDVDHIAHSGGIIGDIVYWTDNLNQPRRYNFMAGIRMNNAAYPTAVLPYTAPLDASVIMLIRKPPVWPITLQKATTGTAASLTSNNAFYFFYSYIYRDAEISTWSERSELAPYNAATDTFDTIALTIPLSETIQQDVQKIQLGVIYAQDSTGFIINTWDKGNATDAAAIIAHNTGTPLSYNFFNDSIGAAIASADVAKLYDAVPLQCEAMELAKYRLFLANTTIAYTSPNTTSLTLTPNISSPSTAISRIFKSDCAYQGGVVFYDKHNRQCGVVTANTVRARTQDRNFSASSVTSGINWALSNANALNEIPDFAEYADVVLSKGFRPLTFIQSRSSFITYAKKNTAGVYVMDGTITSYAATCSGIAFKDDYLVSYGIGYTMQAGDIAKVYINGSATPTSLLVIAQEGSFVICELVNMGTLTTGTQVLFEIYSPKQQVANSQFFERAQRIAISGAGTIGRQYAATAGAFNGDCYLVERKANNRIIFDVPTDDSHDDGLIRLGMNLISQDYVDSGYSVFSQQADGYGSWDGSNSNPSFVNNSTSLLPIDAITITVIGTLTARPDSGSTFWVLANVNKNNNTNDNSVRLEAYLVNVTEVDPSAPQTFTFSVDIKVPSGCGMCIYRLMSDNGNQMTVHIGNTQITYLVPPVNTNATYFAEAMSPNDKMWGNWYTDAGRQQAVDTIGQTAQGGGGSFSNTIIPGSQVNGLSSFDALDVFALPLEMGDVRKLVLTQKMEESGSVMLAMGEQETASIYLGEQRITSSSGATQFLASAGGVVGTIDPLRGRYGTQNPESVVAYNGNVYWVDVARSAAVQYSTNGLYNAAESKATRFWNQFCATYRLMTSAQLRALGNTPYIYGGFEPYHREYLASLPKTLSVPPKGYLADYGNARPYPYDQYDGLGKTMVFKVSNDPNSWQGAYSYVAEGFAMIGNTVYYLSAGQLWKSGGVPANFFGVQHTCRLAVSLNESHGTVKVFRNIALEGCTVAPSFTHLRTEVPYVQSTDLIASDYTNLEGKLYADFYRDRLTPSATSYDNGQLTGDAMRSEYGLLLLEFDGQSSPTFKHIQIGFEISNGQTT